VKSRAVVLIIGALLVLGCTAGKGNVTKSSSTSGGLLPAIKTALRSRNPTIDSVAVLSVRAIYPGGEVAVVGWGTQRSASPPRDSQHGWENELFGIYIFSPTLAELRRTVDTFPTKRWHDYDVQIQQFGRDSLVVVGRSIDYGEEIDRRAYKW
jgi:hypothetical protein